MFISVESIMSNVSNGIFGIKLSTNVFIVLMVIPYKLMASILSFCFVVSIHVSDEYYKECCLLGHNAM
jgi:hypothetical protein